MAKELRLYQEDKIKKVSGAIAGAVEWVLVTILRAINFVLRNFVIFCQKDIKGIYFVIMVVAFSVLIILAKMTRDIQVEMIKSVCNMKTTIIETQEQREKKPEEKIEDKKREPAETKQVSYDTSKAKIFISNYRQGNSPIADYVDYFFQGDVEKGKLALAICGNETAFGTVGYGTDKWNCWGWKANLGGNNWEENIAIYLKKANGYLSMFDGTKESLMKIQQAGYHPVDIESQKHWANSIMWFYNNL